MLCLSINTWRNLQALTFTPSPLRELLALVAVVAEACAETVQRGFEARRPDTAARLRLMLDALDSVRQVRAGEYTEAMGQLKSDSVR